jgi:hypothetical protein
MSKAENPFSLFIARSVMNFILNCNIDAGTPLDHQPMKRYHIGRVIVTTLAFYK